MSIVKWILDDFVSMKLKVVHNSYWLLVIGYIYNIKLKDIYKVVLYFDSLRIFYIPIQPEGSPFGRFLALGCCELKE